MNEIKQRTNRVQGWQYYLGVLAITHQWEWCICMGLCETAGWIDEDGLDMLEWVKPGYKDI